jgi:histidinol-phosphate aminotransferase
MDQASPISRRTWLRAAGLGVVGAGLLPRAVRPLTAADLEVPPLEGQHINLAGNENPFGPAPAVVQAIFRGAPRSSRYPFREEFVLKEMLAKKEGVSVDHIVLTNGCDELLSLVACEAAWTARSRKGGQTGELVATHPTYFQITDYAEKLGLTMRWVPHDRTTMQHDLAGMAKVTGDATRLVYVCNPDNPSGTRRSGAEVAAFCREVAARCPVFLDEVYLELDDDFAAETQVPLVRAGLPVIIGRSFSKLHGMAGHRIGYGITTPAIATALSRWQMSSVNFLGVAAARASLLERDFLTYSSRKIREGRTRFCSLLDELGLRYTPSHGNFVFHHTGRPIGEFQAAMKARGFLVGWPHAPIENYLDWCRVSIGTDDEMAAYATAMREEFRRT